MQLSNFSLLTPSFSIILSSRTRITISYPTHHQRFIQVSGYSPFLIAMSSTEFVLFPGRKIFTEYVETPERVDNIN